MADIHLTEISNSFPRKKPAPQSSKLPVPFIYSPSEDGTDQNLLLILHGLGDTHLPFSKMGKSLNLPQTAILALRAPEQIPFLYEQAYQWYPSFDQLGELIERPNPTPAINLLQERVLSHLTDDCQWQLASVHLFGFSQGGSVALELGQSHWKAQIAQPGQKHLRLGSIVSVGGPLLSYPTMSVASTTPVMVAYRQAPSATAVNTSEIAAIKRGFLTVSVVDMGNKKEGMPASKEEWYPILKFWSENLGKREMEGLYQVVGNPPQVPPI